MNYFIIIFIFIIGAFFGSFFSCMGYRIPNKITLTKPNSFCDHCKKELKWYMLIPILSYIFLKGKCAYCNKKIDAINFIIEVFTALLYMLSYIKFNISMDFFIAIILTSTLMVTIVSDFKYLYISDRVIFLSLVAIIITIYIYNDMHTMFYSILYGIVMFIIMFFIKQIGNKLFKKESLGDGDIKLMGVIGSAVGIANSIITIFLASLFGLIFAMITLKKNKEGIIPFGPFLLIGALIVLYFKEPLNLLIEYLFN